MNSKYYENLIDEILAIENKEELNDFFDGLLTITEKEEISRRLEIIKRLKKGVAQRRVAKELGVGISTVTRGSMEIKKGKFRTLKV